MKIARFLFVTVCCILSSGAIAAPSIFHLDAAITQIGVTAGGQTTLFDNYDFQGLRFALGDHLDGRVAYGTGSSMSDSNGTSDSILIYTNALQSIVLNVPSAHFSTRDIGFNSGLIAVSDNLNNFDSILFTEFGPSFTTARVYFDDETGRAFNDFSLPAEFNASIFSYGFADFSLVDVPSGERLFVSARISTSAFETPLPEPSALVLIAATLLIMVATRRRRSTPPQDSATLQNL